MPERRAGEGEGKWGACRAALRGAALLVAALLLSGCGDLLSGGQKEIDLHATGGGGREGSGNVRGTVSFDVALRLVDEEGALVRATEAPVRGEVLIERPDSVRVVRAAVPPREYRTVRAVFTRVEAEVTGGLVVGGLPILGFAAVDIPPGDSLVVEFEMEMGVAARAREVLVLDLVAAAWLRQVDPLTRRVPAAAFTAVVEVRHH